MSLATVDIGGVPVIFFWCFVQGAIRNLAGRDFLKLRWRLAHAGDDQQTEHV